MKKHILTGIDGANPLAFLAALGLLRVLEQRFAGEARLAWRDEGRWRPEITWPDDGPDLVNLVLADRERWRTGDAAAALRLGYEKDKSKQVHDLKPAPARFRSFVAQAAAAWPGNVAWAEFAAAYATEAGRDSSGNTKPTAFHFTAGQQAFLDMVIELRDGLTAAHIQEALDGPWLYASRLPLLRWDVSGERLYALLGFDPATDKAQGVPGADWLAFQGMSFFPTHPRGTNTLTTGFEGKGKEPFFIWPLWTVPITASVVRSLLGMKLGELSPSEQKAMAIGVLLRSKARRSDRGYGNFSAAHMPPPPG